MLEIYVAIVIFGLTNFVVGAYLAHCYHQFKKHPAEIEERVTYCNGWLDGLYYVTEETATNLLYEELAVRAYEEYKGIKHGPTKH